MSTAFRMVGIASVFFAWSLCTANRCFSQELKIPYPKPAADQQLYIDFYSSKYLQWYDQNTQDAPAIRTQAKTFLQLAINRNHNPVTEMAEIPVANEIAMGKATLEAGSNDPLVISQLARLYFHRCDWRNGAALAEKALTALPKSTYPCIVKIETLITLNAVIKRIGDPKKRKQTEQAVLDELPTLLTWYASEPDWLGVGYRTLVYSLGDVTFGAEAWATSIKKCENAAGCEPWLLEIFKGIFHDKTAWHARGDEYANKVTEKGWKAFEKHMLDSGKHFREAYRMHPELPFAASSMIKVAMTGHDADSVEDWFRRATDAEFDFPSAYSQKMWGLRPRWGGSHEAMLEFGYECVETDRFDTKVPYQLVQALYDIRSEFNNWKEVFKHDGLYDRAIGVLDEYILYAAENPDISDKWRIECLAQKIGLAIHNEDWVLAAKAFEELGTARPLKWWSFFDINQSYDQSRVYAYLEFGEKMEEVRELTRSNDFNLHTKQSINSGYASLLRQCRDDRSKLYVQTWIDSSQMQIDFLNDKWVDLDFSPDFQHWRQVQGLWEYESPKSVIGSNLNTPNASFFMNHRALFDGPKEVTMDIELIEKTTNYLDIGIRIGIKPREESGMIFFGEPLAGRVGTSAARGASHTGINYTLGAIKPRSLRVRVWNNERYELSINGHRHHYLPKPLSGVDLSEPVVGIGSFSWNTTAGSARMSNVRIKRLTTDPPPPLNDIEANLKYYRHAIETEPDRFDYLNDIGVAHYLAGDVKLAVKQFETAREKIGDNPFIDFIVADAYCESGQYTKGLQAYESHLRSAGKNASATIRIKLAFFLATIPDQKLRNGKRALELANQALNDKKLPKSWQTQGQYACILAELGRFDEALVALDKADSMNPTEKDKEYLKKWRSSIVDKKPYRHEPND